MGKLIVWNGFDDIKALAKPGLHPSTSGMNEYIKKQCGFNSNYQGGYRGYHTIRTVFNELPMIFATAKSYIDPTALICLSLAEGVTKYSTLEYQRTVLGEYDSLLRDFVARWDWSIPLYLAVFHEADNPDYNLGTADPALYRRAVQHVISVMVSQAEYQGVTPDKFCIGGLLLTNSMDEGATSPWAWYAHLPNWMVESGYVGFFWDTYFYVKPDVNEKISGYSVESFKERIDRHLNHVRPYGLTRFIIGETAQSLDTRRERDVIVGSRYHQIQHLQAIEDYLYDGVLELVALFSKRDGPASHNGSLAHWRFDEPMVPYSDSAREAGYIQKRLYLGQKRTY